MAKTVQQASDPVTDGPATPALAPKAVESPAPSTVPVLPAKEPEPTAEEIAILEQRVAKWKADRAQATSGDSIPFGHSARYFNVAIPHNLPLIVRVVAPREALNWGELAIREFNRIRGVISTVHVHTVEDTEGVDG